MMVAPDGHSRLELSKFIKPPAISDHRTALVNALGYLRAMFTVKDIDELEKWFSMRTRIGYATFGEPKDFLLDWQKKLVTNE